MSNRDERGENYIARATGVGSAEEALNPRKGLDFEGQRSVNIGHRNRICGVIDFNEAYEE